MAIGYLTIQARTAHDALPLEGVQIRITDSRGNRIYELLTDEIGETQTIPLETISKSFSQTPYYEEAPFTSYNVLAQANGFNSLSTFPPSPFLTEKRLYFRSLLYLCQICSEARIPRKSLLENLQLLCRFLTIRKGQALLLAYCVRW